MTKVEFKMEAEAFFNSHGDIVTHPTSVGEWYEEEICSFVNFNDVLNTVMLPEGKYKITINFEKI